MKSTTWMLRAAHRGVKLDKPLVEAIHNDLRPEADKWRNVCIKLGFKPMGHKKIIEAFSRDGYVVPFKFGKPSTLEEQLLKITKPDGTLHPWIDYIIKARKFNKLDSTYVVPLLGQDRAYTHFHLDAATGRSTSSDMNFQNIPNGKRPGDIVPPSVKCPDHQFDAYGYPEFKGYPNCKSCGNIRGMFVGDSGWITSLDLAQIELRVFAYLSGDKKLQQILADPKQDLHQHTLDVLRTNYPDTQRVQAKNGNFGSIYSGFNFKSAATIASAANIPNSKLIIGIIKFWIKEFPDAVQWARDQRIEAHKTYKSHTLGGRVLSLLPAFGLDQDDRTGERHIDNCAINYPVQSSAFEVFEDLLITLDDNKLVAQEDFMLQVHDEVDIDGQYIQKLEPHRKDLENLQPFWTPYDIEEMVRWE